MSNDAYPTLRGTDLFRPDEQVFINQSHELPAYCDTIHKHDFIEIAYVTAGEGLHIVGDHRYEVAKGDLFIINYDVPHGFFRRPDSIQSPILYNCVFRPEFLDPSLFGNTYFEDITAAFLFKSLFPDDTASAPDLSLRGVVFHEFGALFGKMDAEYKAAKPGYSDLIRAYLIELIIKIFRLLATAERKKAPNQHRQLVEQAIGYIQEHFHSEIKLGDLALQSFISKNYFSKLFKEVTGIGFSDYVQRLRIDEACRLLRETDLKVIEVASGVGFNDLKFFYEVFKKLTGKTPGDYRVIHTQN